MAPRCLTWKQWEVEGPFLLTAHLFQALTCSSGFLEARTEDSDAQDLGRGCALRRRQ